MQKLLDDNDILKYSTYGEGKLVVSDRFIKTLECKIFKKMTANKSSSYLGYLYKFPDKYSNNCHSSISKKPIDADYFPLNEEIETNPKGN